MAKKKKKQSVGTINQIDLILAGRDKISRHEQRGAVHRSKRDYDKISRRNDKIKLKKGVFD